MRSLFNLLERQNKKAQNRKEKAMQEQKKSYVTYVYGQIYASFLANNKKKLFKVTNIHVREWKNILNWLKKKEYIVDFQIGDTIETACDLVVEGFNEDKKIYKKYLQAIEKNVSKEQAQ